VTSPTVRRASTDEIHEIGDLIALTFNDLDAEAYLIPPLGDRRRVWSVLHSVPAACLRPRPHRGRRESRRIVSRCRLGRPPPRRHPPTAVP
jgi:hypothetical protein